MPPPWRAATPAVPQVATGSTQPGGYLDLAGSGVALHSMGDETISNFNVASVWW